MGEARQSEAEVGRQLIRASLGLGWCLAFILSNGRSWQSFSGDMI